MIKIIKGTSEADLESKLNLQGSFEFLGFSGLTCVIRVKDLPGKEIATITKISPDKSFVIEKTEDGVLTIDQYDKNGLKK